MKKLFFFSISLILYSNCGFTQSAKLVKQESEVIEEIWGKLGLSEKKEWDFSKDPCSGEGKWFFSVLCNCSFESNTTCHVTQIAITNQNISTHLPSDFTKLPYLRFLDLSHNYFNGPVPSEWATMRLSFLSLMGNRLSDKFPAALTSLQVLSIEGNRFSGLIPKEIANLKSLRRLDLSSNNFTGQLPVTLAELTNLTHLRISDNNFTGTLPNYISHWTKIEKLFLEPQGLHGSSLSIFRDRARHIQGCSLEGPIPSSISVLTQLNDLRISDLKGGASTFPRLENMKKLSILVLRNCLMHGPIPDYIGNLRSLQTLDLSFNKLTGHIPSSFSHLGNSKFIYLTENNLTGPIPGWILSSTNVDVSYNHFTWDASGPKKCDGTVNVVESYSSASNKQHNIHPCLRKDFPCTKSNALLIHSLHINCGGEEVITNKVTYEADTERNGASTYFNGGYWAFSSTGNFLDDGHDADAYILSNTSNLHHISISDTELYVTARTTAISLTYYGLCLMNGRYTVKLHFAEIVFTQHGSSNILGKRVFNVYVQGELKLKDFDIVKEARGTGRAVVKSYMVDVKNNTLKIQLYWAGKGTTGIPVRGNYGPIISAISVDPTFKGPDHGKSNEVDIIAGIVGGLCLLSAIIVFLWKKGYLMSKDYHIETDQMSHSTSFG